MPKKFQSLKKLLTFTLKARKGHELPLLDEEISTVLTGGTYLLELLSHKLALTIADALGKGSFDVNGKSLWTLDS